MTNKEYITKSLNGLNVSEDDIDIILLKSGLNPDGEADWKGADRAIYQRMSVVLRGMIQNISEGGYSLSWNMEAVRLFYTTLADELGEVNVLLAPRPKLRNRSNCW
jgi:hypothetical protein